MQTSEIALLVVCAVGVVCAVAVIAGFFLWRRRRAAKRGGGGGGGCFSWGGFSSAGETERAASYSTGSRSSSRSRSPSGYRTFTAHGSRGRFGSDTADGSGCQRSATESAGQGAVEYLKRQRARSHGDLQPEGALPGAGDAHSLLEEFGLDPSLYRSDAGDAETAAGGFRHETSLGRLCVGLEFDAPRSALMVTVVRAKYLMRRRPSNVSLFYVSVQTESAGSPPRREKRRTQLVSAVCNPQFQRTVTLPCGTREAAGCVLSFKVKERTAVGKPHLLGRCSVPVAPLLDLGPGCHEFWRELESPAAGGGTQAGIPSKMFVSLSYSQQKKLLTVGIIECRDLKVKDTDASVFFRVSIMARERTVKAKKGPPLKENMSRPRAQQEFRFHLAPNLSEETYLFLLVCARTRIGGSRLLGKAVIGPVSVAQGTGADQWGDCFRSQPSIVFQWHDIY